MNKCSSLLDFFLCCPVKRFLNKCIVKPKTPDEKKDSNKIIVEELKKDIHEDADSLREISEIREIFIDSTISDSEFNKPKNIPNLKLKNLVKKDSLSDFIDNNYLNNDLSNLNNVLNKQNYGSNIVSEIRVNND